jgi:hypothetical protein
MQPTLLLGLRDNVGIAAANVARDSFRQTTAPFECVGVRNLRVHECSSRLVKVMTVATMRCLVVYVAKERECYKIC